MENIQRSRGGIMRIGSLVKTPVNGIGVVVDMSDEWSKKLYLLHYISGTKHWWAADHLEVLCE
jgi:hypothetical protein